MGDFINFYTYRRPFFINYSEAFRASYFAQLNSLNTRPSYTNPFT